jgi:hypothetical protein
MRGIGLKAGGLMGLGEDMGSLKKRNGKSLSSLLPGPLYSQWLVSANCDITPPSPFNKRGD